MRLIWTLECGWPRPLTNVPIFDRRGRHIGTPDLFDPTSGIAGEYDGAVHLTAERRRRDLGRIADFRAVGIDVVTAVAGGWDEFRQHLGAAYNRTRERGDWTLEQPDWWRRTHRPAA